MAPRRASFLSQSSDLRHPRTIGRRPFLIIMFIAFIFQSKYAESFLAPSVGSCRHRYVCCRTIRSSPAAISFCSHGTDWLPKRHPDTVSTRSKRTYTRLYSSTSEDDDSKQSVSTEERNLGILVLCSVPLAWGTFEPAVRYVYTIKPAVPGFVFSVCYYLVAAVALSTLALLSNQHKDGSDDSESAESKKESSLPILGGIELGTYLFLGNGLQVLGLKTVPSDRAAFLLQLTTVSFLLCNRLDDVIFTAHQFHHFRSLFHWYKPFLPETFRPFL